MKVYIIEASDYDYHQNLGVYSTEEKAEIGKEKFHSIKYNGILLYPKTGKVSLYIEEYEVD
jgi:hypothetical protein